MSAPTKPTGSGEEPTIADDLGELLERMPREP
jgi:hypothetical protein